MAAFNLTAQLQLQAPTNVSQVVSSIRKQLAPIGIKVNVAGDASSVARINKQIQGTTRSVNDLNRTLQESARRFSVITLATGTLLGFVAAVKNSVRSALDFEKSLVNLSQITGKTTDQLKPLSDEVTRLSITLGTSSKDLINAAQTLAQAGFSAEKTKKALDILAKTTLASSFGNIVDTTEGAIAALSQFTDVSASTATQIEFLEKTLNSINSVSKAFAVESSDLITVIRRTGGVFSAAGGSVEELIALFTSVRATTRESAETIATGLRTIFTRIQRPETINQLKELGIELQDSEGKFIGAYEAVKRLSQGLSALDPRDIRFAGIIEELGGFRQVGKVIPLIKQFTVAQDALNIAQASSGSVAEDARIAQQSLANQIVKLREEFDALIRKFADSGSFRSIAGGAIELARAFIKVADSLEPLLPLITSLFALKLGSGLAPGIASLVGIGNQARGGTGRVSKFASGGVVPGSGNRDTVPAMLTPGEFVIRKSSVKKLGVGTLHAMNQNKYAGGGKIKIKPGEIGAFFLNPAQGTDIDGEVDLKIPITNPSIAKALGLTTGKGKLTQEQINAQVFANASKDKQARLLGLNPKEVKSKIKYEDLFNKEGGFARTVRPEYVKAYTKNLNKIQNFAETSQVKGKNKETAKIDALEAPLTGKIEGFFTSNRDIQKNSEVSNLVSSATIEGMKKAIEIASKQTRKIIEGLNPVLPGEAKKAQTKMQNLFSDKGALATIEGYIFEGLISNLTGATVAGNSASFDFPSMSSGVKKRLSQLFGRDASRLVKADAKRTYSSDIMTSLGKGSIPSKITQDLARGDTRGVAFAKGGEASDTVPALLTPGEFVINKQAASRIGYSNLHRMNKNGVAGFAKGGFVGVQKFAAGGGALPSHLDPNFVMNKYAGYFSSATAGGTNVGQKYGPGNVMTTEMKKALDDAREVLKSLGLTGKQSAVGLKVMYEEMKKGETVSKSFEKSLHSINEELKKPKNKTEKPQITAGMAFSGGLEKLQGVASAAQNFVFLGASIAAVTSQMSGLDDATKKAVNQTLGFAASVVGIGATLIGTISSFAQTTISSGILSSSSLKAAASIDMMGKSAIGQSFQMTKGASLVNGAFTGLTAVLAAVSATFLYFEYQQNLAAAQAEELGKAFDDAIERLRSGGSGVTAESLTKTKLDQATKMQEAEAYGAAKSSGALAAGLTAAAVSAVGFGAAAAGLTSFTGPFALAIGAVAAGLGFVAGLFVGFKTYNDELNSSQQALNRFRQSIENSINTFVRLIEAGRRFDENIKEIDLNKFISPEEKTQQKIIQQETLQNELAPKTIANEETGRVSRQTDFFIESEKLAAIANKYNLSLSEIQNKDVRQKQREGKGLLPAEEAAVASSMLAIREYSSQMEKSLKQARDNFYDIAQTELGFDESELDKVLKDPATAIGRAFMQYQQAIELDTKQRVDAAARQRETAKRNANQFEAEAQAELAKTPTTETIKKAEELKKKAESAREEEIKAEQDRVKEVERGTKRQKDLEKSTKEQNQKILENNQARKEEFHALQKLRGEIEESQRIGGILRNFMNALDKNTAYLENQQATISNIAGSGGQRLKISAPRVQEIGNVTDVKNRDIFNREIDLVAGRFGNVGKQYADKIKQNSELYEKATKNLITAPKLGAKESVKKSAEELLKNSGITEANVGKELYNTILRKIEEQISKGINKEEAAKILDPLKQVIEEDAKRIQEFQDLYQKEIDNYSKYIDAVDEYRKRELEGLQNVSSTILRAIDIRARARGREEEAPFAKEFIRTLSAQQQLNVSGAGMGGAGAIAGDLGSLARIRRSTMNALTSISDEINSLEMGAGPSGEDRAKKLQGLMAAESKQRSIIEATNKELERLADQSEKVADIQAMIEKEQRKRGQIKDFIKDFVVGGQEQRMSTLGNIQGLNFAFNQGSLQVLNEDMRKGVVGLLESLSDVQLPGGGGATGKQILDEFVLRDAFRMGFPPEWIQALRGATTKEQRLIIALDALTNQMVMAARIRAEMPKEPMPVRVINLKDLETKPAPTPSATPPKESKTAAEATRFDPKELEKAKKEEERITRLTNEARNRIIESTISFSNALAESLEKAKKEMERRVREIEERVGPDTAEAAGAMNKGGLVNYVATGGSIFEPKGTDTVPAMLTPGEYVLNKKAVDKIGTKTLDAMNNGTMYASKGGPVYFARGGKAEEFLSLQLGNVLNAFQNAFKDFNNSSNIQKIFKPLKEAFIKEGEKIAKQAMKNIDKTLAGMRDDYWKKVNEYNRVGGPLSTTFGGKIGQEQRVGEANIKNPHGGPNLRAWQGREALYGNTTFRTHSSNLVTGKTTTDNFSIGPRGQVNNRPTEPTTIPKEVSDKDPRVLAAKEAIKAGKPIPGARKRPDWKNLANTMGIPTKDKEGKDLSDEARRAMLREKAGQEMKSKHEAFYAGWDRIRAYRGYGPRGGNGPMQIGNNTIGGSLIPEAAAGAFPGVALPGVGMPGAVVSMPGMGMPAGAAGAKSPDMCECICNCLKQLIGSIAGGTGTGTNNNSIWKNIGSGLWDIIQKIIGVFKGFNLGGIFSKAKEVVGNVIGSIKNFGKNLIKIPILQKAKDFISGMYKAYQTYNKIKESAAKVKEKAKPIVDLGKNIWEEWQKKNKEKTGEDLREERLGPTGSGMWNIPSGTVERIKPKTEPSVTVEDAKKEILAMSEQRSRGSMQRMDATVNGMTADRWKAINEYNKVGGPLATTFGGKIGQQQRVGEADIKNPYGGPNLRAWQGQEALYGNRTFKTYSQNPITGQTTTNNFSIGPNGEINNRQPDLFANYLAPKIGANGETIEDPRVKAVQDQAKKAIQEGRRIPGARNRPDWKNLANTMGIPTKDKEGKDLSDDARRAMLREKAGQEMKSKHEAFYAGWDRIRAYRGYGPKIGNMPVGAGNGPTQQQTGIIPGMGIPGGVPDVKSIGEIIGNIICECLCKCIKESISSLIGKLGLTTGTTAKGPANKFDFSFILDIFKKVKEKIAAIINAPKPEIKPEVKPEPDKTKPEVYGEDITVPDVTPEPPEPPKLSEPKIELKPPVGIDTTPGLNQEIIPGLDDFDDFRKAVEEQEKPEIKLKPPVKTIPALPEPKLPEVPDLNGPNIKDLDIQKNDLLVKELESDLSSLNIPKAQSASLSDSNSRDGLRNYAITPDYDESRAFPNYKSKIQLSDPSDLTKSIFELGGIGQKKSTIKDRDRAIEQRKRRESFDENAVGPQPIVPAPTPKMPKKPIQSGGLFNVPNAPVERIKPKIQPAATVEDTKKEILAMSEQRTRGSMQRMDATVNGMTADRWKAINEYNKVGGPLATTFGGKIGQQQRVGEANIKNPYGGPNLYEWQGQEALYGNKTFKTYSQNPITGQTTTNNFSVGPNGEINNRQPDLFANYLAPKIGAGGETVEAPSVKAAQDAAKEAIKNGQRIPGARNRPDWKNLANTMGIPTKDKEGKDLSDDARRSMLREKAGQEMKSKHEDFYAGWDRIRAYRGYGPTAGVGGLIPPAAAGAFNKNTGIQPVLPGEEANKQAPATKAEKYRSEWDRIRAARGITPQMQTMEMIRGVHDQGQQFQTMPYTQSVQTGPKIQELGTQMPDIFKNIATMMNGAGGGQENMKMAGEDFNKFIENISPIFDKITSSMSGFTSSLDQLINKFSGLEVKHTVNVEGLISLGGLDIEEAAQLITTSVSELVTKEVEKQLNDPSRGQSANGP